MKKVILSALAIALALPFAASAASITNVEYSNGDVTVQGTAGQSVNGKVRVVVSAGEEVERVQFDVISDSLAPVCIDANRLQEGTHFVQIPGDVKFPPNTGTYSLEVKTAGIFGGLAAIDCVSNVNGSASFGGSVRTVGGTGTVSGSSTYDALVALIASLQKKIEDMSKPATPPAASGKCAALATKMTGAVQGTTASGNIVLQGYLLSEGANIPALAAGAAFGFYGPQTSAAVSWFKSVNACM